MSYLRRFFRHGDIIEDCKYTNGKHGKKGKNSEPIGVTPPEQVRWQSKNDIRKLWRLIDDNFNPGDLWVMLSYPYKCKPSTEQVRGNMSNFLKKMKKIYVKTGTIFKYVYSAGRGKRGAVHFHLILPKFDIDIVRNLWCDIINGGQWVKTNFDTLTKRKDYERLASYIVKNSEETFSSDDPIYKKRYCNSTNLKRKKVKAKVVKAKEWKKEPIEREGYYIDKDRSFSWVNQYGYEYQYTVYVRLSEGWQHKDKQSYQQSTKQGGD